jgi:hypothetical protein
MVMGVDQPRQDHMLAGVENVSTGRGRLLADGEHFNDHTVLHNQTATGIEAIGSEDSEGIF